MKRMQNLLLVLLAVLISSAMGARSSAEVDFYMMINPDPAPGLESWTLYVSGAKRFENLTIDGYVHQVNQFGGWPATVVSTAFLGTMPPEYEVFDTHFMFHSSEILNDIPGTISEQSDIETNDKSNPMSIYTYGGFYTGMGTFDCTGEVLAFEEALPDNTPFMQIVIPKYCMFSVTGLVWDDNDEIFPFHLVLALYDGSHISTTPASGGTLEFPLARIGTTVSAELVISDAGNDLPGYPSYGIFPAAHGEFGPNCKLWTGPLECDEPGHNESESRTYTYTPNERGTDTLQVIVENIYEIYDFPSSIPITLSGTGVGPVFTSSVTPGEEISFGDVPMGLFSDVALQIENTSSDGDLGELTDLSLLSAEITGEDANMFSLVDFQPGTIIEAVDTYALMIHCDTAGAELGPCSATLTITTDQNAAFGSVGEQFVFQLGVTVSTVPEPSILILLTLGFLTLLVCKWQRR